MASVQDRRKPISEHVFRSRESIKGQYKVLVETYGAMKSAEATVKQRFSDFERAMSHGEMGGLKISTPSGTLNESLTKLNKAQKLLNEDATEARVKAEMKRLLVVG